MNKKALFIGLTTIDIQHFIVEFPTPNQKIKTEPPHVYVGGPAANAAVTYSFLGGTVDFLSCIGKNPFTEFIIKDLIKHNLNVIDLRNHVYFNPIISSVLTTINSNDRSIVSHYPETININEKEISSIDLNNYNLIFTDGFYPEIAIPICRKAKEMGIPVFFDGGSWKPRIDEILENVDIAICSDNFFPPCCTDSKVVIEYLKSGGINKIAITRGEKSIIFSENDLIETIEIDMVDTIDSLGAGDIFHGAFIWFWINDYNFRDSLKRASKIATFSTCFKGTRSWMNSFSDISFI